MKIEKNNRYTARVQNILIAAALSLAALIVVFPFFWMISSSFKPGAEMFLPGLHLFPARPTIEHYVTALTRAPIPLFLWNGVLVCSGILLGQLSVIIPAGYSFARLRFRGQSFLFSLVLAALVVPAYIQAIPNFLLLSRLRLINSYAALILPSVGSPFGVFLMRQFFKQMPGEILEAARIDGAGFFRIILSIFIPLTRPAIAAFSVFSIVSNWNEYFWPLVVVRNWRLYTPPAGIAFFSDQDAGDNWSVVMAASVLVVVPLVLMFLVARKQFMESLSHTGVKG